MSTPKGYPIKGRLDENDDVNGQNTRNVFNKEFTTVPFKGINRVGLDVVGGGYAEVETGTLVEVDSTESIIHVTGHSYLKGDLIRFLTTANSIDEFEMFVGEVLDVDHVQLYSPLSAPLLIGDEIEVLRYVSEKVAADGSSLATVNSGPVRIQRGPNGVFLPVEVTKDTADISNTIAMPVEIVGVNGTEINVTAGDINVQTTDLGVNFDSQRVGDGSGNYMAVNAAQEATVRDGDAITELQAILAKILAAPSTEAKQDTVITALGTLLTELQLKADLTETQPVSIAASMPLPTGAATEAKQDTAITALNGITTPSDTQPISAAALPLPTGAATQATLAALLVELQLKAGLAETQPVSLVSQPLPTGAATEVKQDDIITELQSIVASTNALDNRAFVLNDNSSVNILNVGGTTVIADIGVQACSKIKITCTFGVFMELLVNGTPKAIVPKGGFSDGFLEVAMPASASIGFRSLSGADITAGEIVVNVMG